MLAWIYLATAIAVEVGATIALRYSDGFTKLAPAIAAIAGFALSVWLLAIVVKHLEVSLVYAVWAGVGTAAIALIGMTALDEAVTGLKLASLGFVIAGVVGLNLSGSG
jgi:small multidrug resistance pump